MNAWTRKLGEIYAGLLQLHGYGYAQPPNARGENAGKPAARRPRRLPTRIAGVPQAALSAWSGR